MRTFVARTIPACDCCHAPAHPAGCVPGGSACECDRTPWHPDPRFIPLALRGGRRCQGCARCPQHCECLVAGLLAVCPRCGYPYDTSDTEGLQP